MFAEQKSEHINVACSGKQETLSSLKHIGSEMTLEGDLCSPRTHCGSHGHSHVYTCTVYNTHARTHTHNTERQVGPGFLPPAGISSLMCRSSQGSAAVGVGRSVPLMTALGRSVPRGAACTTWTQLAGSRGGNAVFPEPDRVLIVF